MADNGCSLNCGACLTMNSIKFVGGVELCLLPDFIDVYICSITFFGPNKVQVQIDATESVQWLRFVKNGSFLKTKEVWSFICGWVCVSMGFVAGYMG